MMTLFTGATCPFSHIARVVLHEKGCDYTAQVVDDMGALVEDSYSDKGRKGNFDVYMLNPYGELPVLVERDFMLYGVQIITEYIDSRFPHPQLYPSDPAGRARTRLFLTVLERELFPSVRVLQDKKNLDDPRREKARNYLRTRLTYMAPRLANSRFMMGEEFSIVDAYMAPILWRLQAWEVSMQNEELVTYAERLFARQAFVDSMNPLEKSLRK